MIKSIAQGNSNIQNFFFILLLLFEKDNGICCSIIIKICGSLGFPIIQLKLAGSISILSIYWCVAVVQCVRVAVY
ncbi:hypothetical protein WJ82_23535 [Burkholderia ubonensis]|nr:hypothetical protein WJ82_23535 [Burkholderia ubonensis]